MADNKIVTKEIFLQGCKFFHRESSGMFWSIPDKNPSDSERVHLNHSDYTYFANVSRVDKSGFNFYTTILGKRISARVKFDDLFLLERKEASNG